MQTEATKVSDVQIPVLVVELVHLKTSSGEPVRVECGVVNDLVVRRTLGLPGARPKRVQEGDEQDEEILDVELAEQQRQERMLEEAGRWMTIGPPLIEAGTALLADDGVTRIRPAFWFTADPGNGAIDGRHLRIEDIEKLSHAIMYAGGYVKEAPARAGDFPGRGRGGPGDGVGAGEPGEAGRDDTAAGVSGS